MFGILTDACSERPAPGCEKHKVLLKNQSDVDKNTLEGVLFPCLPLAGGGDEIITNSSKLLEVYPLFL